VRAADPPASTSSPAPAQAENEAAEPEGSWLDHFSLKADLRYRFELIDEQEERLRYRHRLRARVGLFAELVEGLAAAIQLGTGQSDDPVSNNQTLTEAMSSKPIWLSLGYVSYQPTFAQGAELVAGKFDNRFERVGGSELLWDPDLNPEGIALSYGPSFEMLQPFLKTAAWFLEERAEEDDAWMLGAQTGLKLTLADGIVYVLGGGGYYDYLNTRDMPVSGTPRIASATPTPKCSATTARCPTSPIGLAFDCSRGSPRWGARSRAFLGVSSAAPWSTGRRPRPTPAGWWGPPLARRRRRSTSPFDTSTASRSGTRS
jgi:hypothetical protein